MDKVLLAAACLGLGFALGAAAASSEEQEDSLWGRVLDKIPFRVKAGGAVGGATGAVRGAARAL